MDQAYNFAKLAIICEFIAIAVILISILSLKIYYRFKTRSRQNLTMEVENYLARMIPTETPLIDSEFTKRWRLEVLLPVIFKFARLIDSAGWHDKRISIISRILLPQARQATYSSDWVLRYYAAESFGLMSEKEDEKHIIKLISDDVRLVYLSAINAAIEYVSEDALNIIISRMASESNISQTYFLQAFDNTNSVTAPLVVKRLMRDENIEVKTTCYRLLLKYPPIPLTWNILPDVYSENMALKIVCMRFLTHIKDPSAASLMIQLLEDERWEIRAISIQSLSNLNAIEAIPLITNHLDDPEEWVRLIAAQALINFGEVGDIILRKRKINVDPHLINVTQYVLNNL